MACTRRTTSLFLGILILVLSACSSAAPRASSPGSSRTSTNSQDAATPADLDLEGGGVISLDSVFADSLKGLIEESTVVVRVRAQGEEKFAFFLGQGESAYFAQTFEVLDHAKGSERTGATIEVNRRDLSPEAEKEGWEFSEATVPQFVDGQEYVLFLHEGIPPEGAAPEAENYYIGGTIQGAVPIVNEELRPAYGDKESVGMASELAGRSWDDIKQEVDR